MFEYPSSREGSPPHHRLHVTIRRPSELEAAAILRPTVTIIPPPMPFWRRFTWRPDPDDPNLERELELEMDVDTLHGFAIEELVAHSGVREVLMKLAPYRSDVHLGFSEESIMISRTLREPLPDGREVVREMFLLSLHRERLKL